MYLVDICVYVNFNAVFVIDMSCRHGEYQDMGYVLYDVIVSICIDILHRYLYKNS